MAVVENFKGGIIIRGALSVVNVHKDELNDLIRDLMKQLLPKELQNREPLVLFFATDADRDEMIAATKATFRGVKSVKV